MIKSELIAELSAQNPHLYQRDAQAVVDAILDTITVALARGDRVELRGFGAFAVRRRSARSGRNPRTGKTVDVSESAHLKFKPGMARQNRHITLHPRQQH